MKILYISKSIIPSRTANSIHVMKMCQALVNNGHEVTLLAPNTKKQYENNVNDIFEFYGVKKNFSIKKLWHPNSKLGALVYTFAILIFILANKKFNLVYGRFLPGCYISTFLRNEVVFETHTPIYEVKNHNFFIFKRLIRSRYFKKLVVISQALKKMYLENRYLSEHKIQVAHDGADELLNFDHKADLFGDNNSLKVGYVGHLYKGRGIELIIECAKQLKDISFHIVGGLKKDIDYWKNYSKSSNISNIYFYGFVSPSKVSMYKNSFDILLAPYANKVSVFGNSGDSSKFMSPLKIFEYMSHKKAIIASDLPVLREILNSKNSILVEPENIKDWIGAIHMLRNFKNRHQISNNAFKDFKKYTWKNRALQIVGLSK